MSDITGLPGQSIVAKFLVAIRHRSLPQKCYEPCMQEKEQISKRSLLHELTMLLTRIKDQ